MGFDPYSLVARILPGYIVIAPVIVLLVFLPTSRQLSLGGVALLVPIIYFFSYQIGRERGKGIEPKLWSKWGGAPVTRYLRHSNQEFDADARAQIHAYLSASGVAVPSPEEEQRDPGAADQRYNASGFDIIRRTRDAEQFPLVFRSTVTYGFQRNLLGLKPFGIATALASCGIGIAIITLDQIGPADWFRKMPDITLMASITVGLNIGILLVWLSRVTEHTVKNAADDYARFLLEAARSLAQCASADQDGGG